MKRLDESLQACLEDLEAGATVARALEQRVADAHLRDSLLPLIAVAERYRQAPDVLPSAEFREAARARMLGMIAAQPKARRWPIAWPSRLSPGAFRPAHLARVIAVVLAVLLLTVGGGTAALASPPSSPLFGVRVALEEAEVLVTPAESTRLELRLAIADRRAAELEAMAATASVDDIALAADRYESALRAAVDEAVIAPEGELPLVDRRLASQEETLRQAALAAGTSPIAEKRIQEALAAIARERARLRERSGWNAAAPAEPSPVASPGETASPEATSTSVPSPTLEPSATAAAGIQGSDGFGPGSDQGKQERAGRDQPSATATVGGASTPVPPTSGSTPERTRQQGPTATPAPTLATPGGQVGPQPGSQPVATPSGPGHPSGNQLSPTAGTGGKGGR